MAAFAERLKEAMELKGLKQADVIRLAQPFGEPVGIRIGKSHMSQYVSGKTEPRRDILKVLAQALEVDYLWLEGDDVAMTADSHPAKEQQSKNSWSIGEDGMRTFNKSSKLDNVLYDVRGPVVEEAKRMEDAGMHVLKLNIGNPAPFGFRTPEEVIFDMRQQLTECEGYSDSKGLFSARKAIMQYAQLKNLPNVTINDIYTGNGVSELINLSMQALLDEGDEILIQDPQWLNYVAQVKYCNGTAVRVPTDIAHNFEMQGETIEDLISPRTKAIMINTPNNPTGCVMSEDSLYRIAEIAVKHDLLVISDDVYNTLIYDGAAAPLIAAFPHMRERTVIVNSFSKSFAMTGWRIGFVAGPAEIVDRMTKCQENFNACANSVGQYACAVALDHPELSDMICKTFADRRSVLLKGLKHIEGIKCNCPRGAFYVFADISSFGLTSAEFCNRLLDEEKVVCIPGSAFGTCGEGFIRIAYTCAEEDLNKAILRIQRFCKKLSEKRADITTNSG